MSNYMSKPKKREYAQLMGDLTIFCITNEIQYSKRLDSFYFEINGLNYRVSNHTVKFSDIRMYDDYGQKIRDSYHKNNKYDVEITASKTRLIEIFNNLLAGKTLDKRGRIKK